MNRLPIIVGAFCCLAVIAVVSQRSVAQVGDAPSVNNPSVAATPVVTPTSDATERAEPLAKKCSFSSDCRYGKCKKGRCGGCSFSSDCKGWGKCKKGWCGGCSFSSDCKGFGKCSSGRCTKSPY